MEIRRPTAVTLIAVLHFVVAPFMLIAAVAVFASMTPEDRGFTIGFSAFLVLIGGLQIAIGVGLLRLREWGRLLQFAVSILGLLAFPLGTIVNGLILFYITRPGVKVLFSGKSAGQLTDHERAAVLQLTSGSGSSVAVAVAIGLIVLVGFGGILAAIAVPNLLTAIQRSKQKRSMADMRSIATALEARATDTNEYPDVGSVNELGPLLVPTYIRALPELDGWERSFEYACWSSVEGTPCDSYLLLSRGKDGAPEAKELDQLEGPTTNFDCDILYANGSFIQWPGGAHVSQ
ncbi:MAG: type IV pilin protein [Thermoanaerobaculia bacterium]